LLPAHQGRCRIGALQRHDFNFRIDGVQRLSAGFSLGHADASLRVQDLPLQVGEIDGVIIDQCYFSDAGRCQVECCRRTEAAGTTIRAWAFRMRA
jgi:hypothetical protein